MESQAEGWRLICPVCGSENITRDSASPWIFIGSILVFPITLLLFFLNTNVACMKCGVRFKKYWNRQGRAVRTP